MRHVKLVSNLSKITDGMAAARQEALMQTGADIVSVAKQLCPVRTGGLRQSYGAVPVSSEEVHVGTAKHFAKYVEYGTSRSSAQPHLTPAMMQAEATFKARLIQAVEKRVRR